MRLKRLLMGVVGLVAVGGITACGAVTNVNAVNQVQAVGVSVEVSPNRVSPGMPVQVRARCADNSSSATVSSPAFGNVTATLSSTTNSLLVASVTIPTTTAAGTFTVTVTCRNADVATTKLIVVVAVSVQPTVGPHTGGGALAGSENELGATTSTGAAPWLIGGAAALMLAAAVGGISKRRRRTQATPEPASTSSSELVEDSAHASTTTHAR